MRIIVVGAGAIGGYFGGRLIEAGHDVGFLVRGQTLEVLRSRGLVIKSPLGDLHLEPIEADDDPARLARRSEPVDAVIVTVKAWQVPAVASQIKALVGPTTLVLPLQNGVEAPDQLAEALGSEAVLGGLCKIISKLERRGEVHHLGAEPTIALGSWSEAVAADVAELIETLRGALEEAGVRAEIPEDIRAAMWEKFLFISSVSGLGAVSRMPIGSLRSEAETRALLVELMDEVQQVAAASGITLAAGIVDRTMDFVDSLPAESTASMQRDLIAGRPSELESQNGAVVRLAAQAGVDVPGHRFVYRVLLPLERRARDG